MSFFYKKKNNNKNEWLSYEDGKTLAYLLRECASKVKQRPNQISPLIFKTLEALRNDCFAENESKKKNKKKKMNASKNRNNYDQRILSNEDGETLTYLLCECASKVEQAPNQGSPLIFKTVEALLNDYFAENDSDGSCRDPPAPPYYGCAVLVAPHLGQSSVLAPPSIGLSSAQDASLASRGNSNTASNAKGNDHNVTTGKNNSTTPSSNNQYKKPFQIPRNKKAFKNMIVSGWLEQQHTSKMKMVFWKQTFLSLVQEVHSCSGDEETALWIKHDKEEIIKKIPLKCFSNIRYLGDDYKDFRFCLEVFDSNYEFVFRAPDVESREVWVATLMSAKEANQKDSTNGPMYHATAGFPDALHENSPNNSSQNQNDNATAATKGGGQEENSNSYFPVYRSMMQTGKEKSSKTKPQTHQQTQPQSNDNKERSLTELICLARTLGLGYQSTCGMERADLERIIDDFAAPVGKIQKISTTTTTPYITCITT